MRRLLFIALLIAGCAAVPDVPTPLIGSWGGTHIGATATEVAVSFEFDCAAGRIDAPLMPAPDGRFSASGTYVPGHGGPVRKDEIPPALPATYHGSIRGDLMRLAIDVPSRGLQLGPYQLRRGAEPQIFRCL